MNCIYAYVDNDAKVQRHTNEISHFSGRTGSHPTPPRFMQAKSKVGTPSDPWWLNPPPWWMPPPPEWGAPPANIYSSFYSPGNINPMLSGLSNAHNVYQPYPLPH